MTVQRAIDKGLVARVGIILAVAVLLRCFLLSHQSLWLDEIASWMFASRTLPQVIQAELTNPPLYYLLLHFWIGWFGSSEAAIRSLSVVPSILSVWLLFQLGRRMFDRSVALLSALYLSVSTFQIYYAQEGRCFSLLVCLLLSAAWCFWEALNGEPRRRWVYWAGVTAFGVLALYAHFIAIFFLAGFGLYVLIRRPRQLLGATISIGAALVLFAPFLVRMLAAAGGGGQVRRYLVLKLPQAYFSFLFGDSLIPLDEEAVQHIPATLKSNWWILALALTSVCILLPFVVRAWSRWSQGISLALTMAFFPVLLAFLVSFKVMLFDERYLIPASPFLYMIVCAGLMEILQASRKGQAAAYAGFAVFAILPVLLSISLANYYFNPRFDKEQWREADLYIDSLVPMDGSGLLVFDPDYIEPCYRYYSKRHLPEWRRPDRSPVSIAQVRAHTDPNQRIVLVRSHADNDSLLTTMREALKENTYREFPRANPIEVYSFVAK